MMSNNLLENTIHTLHDGRPLLDKGIQVVQEVEHAATNAVELGSLALGYPHRERFGGKTKVLRRLGAGHAPIV